MTKKNAKKIRKSTTTALEMVPSTVLIPLLGSERSVEKLAGAGGELLTQDGVTRITGRRYATAGRIVPDAEIYFVDSA